jgi:large subunit ribosomal protein L30
MADIKKVAIKLTSGRIRIKPKQKASLDALGLRKINQVTEKVYTPQIAGIIKVVSHLVEVKDV